MPTADTRDLARALALARTRFNYGLDCVSDDRLDWSPSEMAHTPLALARKVEDFTHFFAHLLKHGSMPPRDGPGLTMPGSREEAKARVQAGFKELLAALSSTSESDLDRTMMAPWGATATQREMVWWFMGAFGYLQGQLNYIQLIYGDTDLNVPPGWGSEE